MRASTHDDLDTTIVLTLMQELFAIFRAPIIGRILPAVLEPGRVVRGAPHAESVFPVRKDRVWSERRRVRASRDGHLYYDHRRSQAHRKNLNSTFNTVANAVR